MLDCVACKEKSIYDLILYDFINCPTFVKLFSGCFRQAFNKVVAGLVRQVVVLHSNDRMGICMGGLGIGRL